MAKLLRKSIYFYSIFKEWRYSEPSFSEGQMEERHQSARHLKTSKTDGGFSFWKWKRRILP